MNKNTNIQLLIRPFLIIAGLLFFALLLHIIMMVMVVIITPSHSYPLCVLCRAISRVSPPCWRRPSQSSTAATDLWILLLFPRSRGVETDASVLRRSSSSHTGQDSSTWSLEGLGGSSFFTGNGSGDLNRRSHDNSHVSVVLHAAVGGRNCCLTSMYIYFCVVNCFSEKQRLLFKSVLQAVFFLFYVCFFIIVITYSICVA